jgi:hypothetical protein
VDGYRIGGILHERRTKLPRGCAPGRTR